jgi:mono/diheme cytochrome c family protein
MTMFAAGVGRGSRIGAMRRIFLLSALALSVAAQPRAQTPSLPPPADRAIDFVRDIKPILQNSCVKCHGRGRSKGGFSLETRDAMLEGGDSGAAVTPGASQNSHLIALVAGLDPDLVMPQKGTRLKPEQIGLLRAWIDQGAAWDASVNFAKSEPRNIEPRRPSLVPSHERGNAIDQLLSPYLAEHGVTLGARVGDRQFARRVYLDTIGLLPSPEELRAFVADHRPDKRARLVEQLLADRRRYAEHWLSFWNDVLRNDYRGPGFIDGGRQQITAWLYQSLLDNVSYDRFVAQLINPTPGTGAEGFTKGIIWRGVVNASQTPPMQAAQNVSQVFMGVNLKCASCHDSFINDWQLADAYGLASLYADAPLEMVECDRPTGRTAQAKFLYAKLGSIDAKAARADRLQRLSDIVTSHQNGRLSRTIVNRLWAKFMGRGLVEPVDDMEQPSWEPDLLDWLAEDLVAHGYDLKHTMAQILTSRAYQSAAVDDVTVFRGPGIRRMSAEQFADAVSTVTGVWQGLPAGDFDFTTLLGEAIPPLNGQWIWSASAEDAEVTFQKSFTLTATPLAARMLVNYDGPLVVTFNGRKVAEINAAGAPRSIDLRPALRVGENILSITAKRPAPPSPSATQSVLPPAPPPKPTAPGLFAEVLIRRGPDAAQPLQVIASSNAAWLWRTSSDPAWKPMAVVLGDTKSVPAPLVRALTRIAATASLEGRARAALVSADALTTALGRPNREQVVTTRSSAATTLQALELSNGVTLTRMLQRGAEQLLSAKPAPSRDVLISRVYMRALGRAPSASELKACRELLGASPGAAAPRPEAVQDLLWALVMLPEFQLIY